MTTEIIPLGTASAIPTRDRHLAATALRRKGRLLLFDCGEGTQQRLLEGDLNRARIDAILISHFHGDHFYGLMGMIATMALLERSEPLVVVGPRRIEEILRAMPGLANEGLPFEIAYRELEDGFEQQIVYETDELSVEARPLQHRVFTVGFRFEEKPRRGHLHPERARELGATEHKHFRQLKRGESVTLENGTKVRPGQVLGPKRPGISFAYVMDTRPCAGGRRLARDVDLLYHEATFAEKRRQQAVDTGHATAREAAEVAREAGAGRLLLGHFSARYATAEPLVEEARAVFPNTEAAKELKRYVLDPREKEGRRVRR